MYMPPRSDTMTFEQIAAVIDTMTFEQIAAFLSSIDGPIASSYGLALTQRLYQIALYDNHIPQAYREGASKLLGVIKQTMETAYSASPEVLAEYRKANARMEEGVRRFGVGSLAWLLLENKISDTAEMIEFVARPERRDLLDEFYATLRPDLAKRFCNSSLGDSRRTTYDPS
jgi:hypothetical protein